MNGVAEKQDGYARKLRDALILGESYTLMDLAKLMDCDVTAISRKGVLTKKSSDFQILLVTLKKDAYSVQNYEDHLDGSFLFWSGQNSQKAAEKKLQDGTHDTFVLIQKARKQPYIYYGRAVPLRMQINWEPGIPSHVMFDLPEWAALHSLTEKKIITSDEVQTVSPSYGKIVVPEKTESKLLMNVRTAQTQYRKDVISFWHSQCAVTGVDDTDWLIASHIKPWRESTNEERVDPRNSLLLTPNFDKLFDRGIISFSPKTGNIILPEQQSKQMWSNFNRLHIDDTIKLREVPDGVSDYLNYHNQYVYNFKPNDNLSDDDVVESLLIKGLA